MRHRKPLNEADKNMYRKTVQDYTAHSLEQLRNLAETTDDVTLKKCRKYLHDKLKLRQRKALFHFGFVSFVLALVMAALIFQEANSNKLISEFFEPYNFPKTLCTLYWYATNWPTFLVLPVVALITLALYAVKSDLEVQQKNHTISVSSMGILVFLDILVPFLWFFVFVSCTVLVNLVISVKDPNKFLSVSYALDTYRKYTLVDAFMSGPALIFLHPINFFAVDPDNIFVHVIIILTIFYTLNIIYNSIVRIFEAVHAVAFVLYALSTLVLILTNLGKLPSGSTARNYSLFQLYIVSIYGINALSIILDIFMQPEPEVPQEENEEQQQEQSTTVETFEIDE